MRNCIDITDYMWFCSIDKKKQEFIINIVRKMNVFMIKKYKN